MEMKALEDLFLGELAELYDVEKQIVKALPKMAKATQNKELRAAFESHLKQTERHADRLEKIFKAIGREPESQESNPISEIIKQGDELTSTKKTEPPVLDAALIAAAQKVEHYEIAVYGAARSHAKTLGYLKISALLEETLREEEQTDALLTELAVKRVNSDASKAPFAIARVAPRNGEESSGFGFSGLLAGLAIGAAIAMLYTPKSGENLRKDLKDTADDLRARGEQWRGTAEDLIERGRQTISEQRHRFSETRS
jgi:ferritin-like metal-binding protein YciE